MNNKKFTTFDKFLMEFLRDVKGIKYTNSFKGKTDIGYDYDYIPNLKDILAEYRGISQESIKKNKFEKMMDNFLKDSQQKIRDSNKEHTKNETERKKKDNAKRRKIALKKRGIE